MPTNREKAEELVRGWIAHRALGSFIDRPDESDIIGRVEQALAQCESDALERAAGLLDNAG